VTSLSAVPSALLQQLLQFDTCTVSNAIERLGGRLRNEGSISGRTVQCMFPHLPPTLGYAVTGKMRSTTTPVGGRAYHENINWWRYLASIPEPRVMVVQDADDRPGAGALVGELHASIGLALHCTAYITNGAVRDLPEVEKLGFQLFAGNAAISHMYAHISAYGEPVEIGGLKIAPGDLMHGDLHGVHIIPFSVAAGIPEMAEEILREEEEIKSLCRSPGFSLRRLDEALQRVPGDGVEIPLNGR